MSAGRLAAALCQGLRPLLAGDCLLCGAAAGAHALLCRPCVRLLNHAGGSAPPARACARCAAPLPASAMPGTTCGACVSDPPAFDAAVAAWRYAFPADRVIQGLKFHARFSCARLCASALARRLRLRVDGSARAPDLVIAMPLHRDRLVERGFNQALEIARPLAARLGLPLAERGVARIRATTPQSGLDERDRSANVRGAFRCDLDLRGRSIAVVDDVLTTGATLDALARTLKSAGATRVCAWVAARTP